MEPVEVLLPFDGAGIFAGFFTALLLCKAVSLVKEFF